MPPEIVYTVMFATEMEEVWIFVGICNWKQKKILNDSVNSFGF